jgi:hypothetical protein
MGRAKTRLTRWTMAAVWVAAVGALAVACDIPIYKVASQEWPPEPYMLYMYTQEGLKANTPADALLKKSFDTWLTAANLGLIHLDVRKSMLQEDRMLMQDKGIQSLPTFILVDKDGVKVSAAGTLNAETWKAFDAAMKPAGPFTVLAFTSPAGEPVLDRPKDPTPFPLTVIDFNQATDEQLKRAQDLGIQRYRVPHSVLLNKDGLKIAEAFGKLDAKAWEQFKRASAPTGPFKVIAFTKTELGAPLTEAEKTAPLPVTVVDLDKPDKDGQAWIDRLKVSNLPAMLLMSPRGAELATLGPTLAEPELRRLTETPKKAEIVKVLAAKDHIGIILFIKSKDAKASAAALAATKDAITRGARLFEGKIGLVEIDPADPKEETLFQNLKMKPDGAEPTVLMVFGPGKILGAPPLTWKFTSDDVLDLIQIVMQNCSCVIQPSDLGEDLLLVWPVPKDK